MTFEVYPEKRNPENTKDFDKAYNKLVEKICLENSREGLVPDADLMNPRYQKEIAKQQKEFNSRMMKDHMDKMQRVRNFKEVK